MRGGVMVVVATVAHLVILDAHLDGRNVATVRKAINDTLEAATGDVVVDMGALQLIDAAGLGMLTAAHLRAERAGHRLVLWNCSKELRRVLAVTRLNRVLRLDRGHH
ncbi:MAG: STAS domain-containing protein [Actinomycetota bacterium]|nr:STAS domain-containing protein [Actinomycetota bacterium]